MNLTSGDIVTAAAALSRGEGHSYYGLSQKFVADMYRELTSKEPSRAFASAKDAASNSNLRLDYEVAPAGAVHFWFGSTFGVSAVGVGNRYTAPKIILPTKRGDWGRSLGIRDLQDGTSGVWYAGWVPIEELYGPDADSIDSDDTIEWPELKLQRIDNLLNSNERGLLSDATTLRAIREISTATTGKKN